MTDEEDGIAFLFEHPDGLEAPGDADWVENDCPDCDTGIVLCPGFGIDRFAYVCPDCGHEWTEPCGWMDQNLPDPNFDEIEEGENDWKR